MYKILIVDNDPLHLQASEILLTGRGYDVEVASSGEEAIQKVKENPLEFGIAILDFRMPGKNGSETAKELLAITKNIYILVHTGDGTQEAAVNAFEAGAVGFIFKSDNSQVFLEKVALWCKKYEETHLALPSTQVISKYSQEIASIGLVGASKELANIATQVKKYAPLGHHVLVEGETGTGKERVARALHLGPKHLLFPINCAAYNGNQELMESELFGHLKGSFTGADSHRIGVFRKAQGGTVVLDEIDTLPLPAQQKLLRVLRERTVRPVGSEEEFKVNFRLIATAKPGLEQRSLEGKFMPDLFERLNVLQIAIPPLRQRIEDIAPLVAHFCSQYEQETRVKKRFLAQTVKYFERFDWPRNVAQLENTVKRLCVNTDGNTIQPKHLDPEFFQERNVSLTSQLRAIEKEEIEDAIKHSNSRRSLSKQLMIPETTLRRKLKEFGIPDPFVSRAEGNAVCT